MGRKIYVPASSALGSSIPFYVYDICLHDKVLLELTVSALAGPLQIARTQAEIPHITPKTIYFM